MVDGILLATLATHFFCNLSNPTSVKEQKIPMRKRFAYRLKTIVHLFGTMVPLHLFAHETPVHQRTTTIPAESYNALGHFSSAIRTSEPVLHSDPSGPIPPPMPEVALVRNRDLIAFLPTAGADLRRPADGMLAVEPSQLQGGTPQNGSRRHCWTRIATGVRRPNSIQSIFKSPICVQQILLLNPCHLTKPHSPSSCRNCCDNGAPTTRNTE